jgi:hypothetical protein
LETAQFHLEKLHLLGKQKIYDVENATDADPFANTVADDITLIVREPDHILNLN